MTFLETLRPSDVVDQTSFAEYAQQILGTPIPETKGQELCLQKKLREFFVANPAANWRQLAQTVDWCRAKKKHPAVTWFVLSQYRWAWADRAVTDVEAVSVVDSNVEYAISRALETETDEHWQRMLLGCVGVQNRRNMLAAWRAQ